MYMLTVMSYHVHYPPRCTRPDPILPTMHVHRYQTKLWYTASAGFESYDMS